MMIGFEKFDVRSWAERGITTFVSPVADVVRGDVRRITGKFVAQATMAIMASTGLAVVYSVGLSNGGSLVGAGVEQVGVAEGMQGLAVSLADRYASTVLSESGSAALLLGSQLVHAERAGVSVASVSGLLSQAGSVKTSVSRPQSDALQRFLNRTPAQMSSETERLAEIALKQRDVRAKESGESWATRVMNNIYS